MHLVYYGTQVLHLVHQQGQAEHSKDTSQAQKHTAAHAMIQDARCRKRGAQAGRTHNVSKLDSKRADQ